jgi:hypothetical protein
MKRITMLLALGVLTTTPLQAQPSNFSPNARTLVLAHNAYPYQGKWADRLDRAIASGIPLVAEEDLAWVDGKSLLIHGAKNASADDPTLESYFFPKVAPAMESAIRSGDKSKWPLIILYLDIKNDPPEHLEAIGQVLDRYSKWLTTAVKTADITKQSPLKLGPMMVIVEDKQNDIKQQYFYDRVPVGGEIRVFGSVTKPAENPAKLPKQDYINTLPSVPLEQITTSKADNYRRWWGVDSAYVEKGGEAHHSDWGPEQQTRLKSIVDYGHSLGYVMAFYCLDGYAASDDQGWDAGYNFGSRDVVEPRWRAAIAAHTDLISTDQYQELADIIRSRQVSFRTF